MEDPGNPHGRSNLVKILSFFPSSPNMDSKKVPLD
jgi:hypothetical protein